MISVAKLKISFWAEAHDTTGYLQNCSYTSALQDITPYELSIRFKLHLRNLYIFGCSTYVHLLDEHLKK